MKIPLATLLRTTVPRASAHTKRAFLSSARVRIADRAKKLVLRALGVRPPASPSGLGEILLPAARTRWQLPALRSLTPDIIESILRDAATGSNPRREHELYSLMEQTWPRLAKNLSEIKNTVIGLEWSIRHPGDTPDAAAEDLVSRARLGMRGDPCAGTLGWEGTLRHLLEAWFRGVSIAEIDWRATPRGILPAATRPIPCWHYGWHRDSGRLMLYPHPGDPSTAIDIPHHKFLVAVHNAGSGHPSSGALLRPLVWWWLASNFCSEWFLNYAQLFGQPYRTATYPRGDTQAAEALSIHMAGCGAAGFAVVPEGTEIQFHDAGKSASENPQAVLMDRADRACDILLLGQTLTTDVGDSGSRALGDVHTSVRSDIIDAAASWLAEVLNEQLIPSLFEIYTGARPDPATLPWWEPGRKQSIDTKVTAETIEILVRAGLPIPRDWAYEVLDIPAPEPGEAVIEAPAPAAPDPAAFLAGLPTEARAYLLAKLGSG